MTNPLKIPFLGLLVHPMGIAALGLLSGCMGSGPLDDDQPRTPYAQYRELRGDNPPLNTENSLGESRPNLRERLLRP